MSNTDMQQRLVPIAPAASLQSASSPEDALMPYTCQTCTRRKVKCDKLAPVCSTCRKSSLECIYQAPAPRKRKRKPVDEMHDRLEHYEKLLKQSGMLAPDEESTPTRSETIEGTPNSGNAGDQTHQSTTKPKLGKLHKGSQGKARYINGGFWRNMQDIDYQPSDEEDEDDPDVPLVPGHQTITTRDPLSSALFGPGSPLVDLIDAHPTYEAALKLWSIYVENVDPVCKVLHVPTTQKMLQRAASNPSTASKATEAVLFAVYNIAIESISDEECEEMFHQPRPTLQARYMDAVRHALVNAQFLKTIDLLVLQAFILFLLCTRTVYDPHTFWVLTGVAVRIGQRMGLHQSGLEKDLNPFDVQLRRRVFWQLLPLDGIASQQCGTGIAITFDTWNTEQPLNINDEDIWPGMEHEPVARESHTDMIFCLARTELAKFIQRSAPNSSDWARFLDSDDYQKNLRSVREVQANLEDKYVRYCDITEPVHCLTLLMTRAAGHMGMFRIRMPYVNRPGVTDEEKAEQWYTAVKCLDTDTTAHSNPLMKRYRWHLQAIVQWEPLIWILYELQRRPAACLNDKIWGKVETFFGHHPEIFHLRRALHVAVSNLTLRAWASCRAIEKGDQPRKMPQKDPEFIAMLREALQKREQARSKPTRARNDYNPFDAGQDAAGDLAEPSLDNVNFTNDFAEFGDISGMNLDSSDWMFWDQMIHDPNAYSLGYSN